MHAAIGAGRWRLLRQMLVESLVLAALACGAGLALAAVTIDLVAAMGPRAVSQLGELSLDARVVCFAMALAAGTVLLFGFWPAVQLSRPASGGALHEGSLRATASRGRRWFGGALVVAEVALALVLVAGAGLLVRSFLTLVRIDPGFARSNVAALQVFAYGPSYASGAQVAGFFGESLERVRALPGVEAAGLVSAMPFLSANIDIRGELRIEGRPDPRPEDVPRVSLTVATADYFRAMRVPLKRGRLFSEGDRHGALPVTIVNEVMAERYWPDGDALGRRLTVSWQGRPRTVQIVGVVGALRHDGLDAAPRPEIFLPFDQMPFGSMTFVVRATGDAAALVPSVKARIWEVDPTLPFYDVATLDGLVAESLTPRRVMMQLLGALAGLAFILAAAGLYGLLSFSTAQRTREIGVRMAMGARTRDILRLVVGEGLVLVGVGVLVGLAGALAVTRVLAASLFQVSPTDPATFLLATALLFAVGLLACYLPARRAARVDPLTALRVD